MWKVLKFGLLQKLLQVKQLTCIKQYVLEYLLKTIKTMTNNLVGMIFDDSLYLGEWAKIDLQ